MKTQGFPENDSSHKQVSCVTIVTLQKQRRVEVMFVTDVITIPWITEHLQM